MSWMKHKALIACVGVFVILVALGYVMATGYFFSHQTHPKHAPNVQGLVLQKTRPIPAFRLTTDKNQSFTQQQLTGHWSLLFFGFTHCPKVCPTTMAALNKMYQTLSHQLPKSALPQVIMVSIDPERDDMNRMHAYINAFNSAFIGLRGNEHALKPLQKAMYVVAEKQSHHHDSPQHYTMQHTASIMVIDPKGQLRAFLSYPHKASVLVADYHTILNTYGQA